MTEMIHAAIFDFDGVVAETESARFVYLQKVLRQKNIKVPNNYRSRTFGRTTKNLLNEDFYDKLSHQQIAGVLQQYQDEFKDHVADFAKPVISSLDFLRSYKGQAKIALASMSPRNSVIQILHKFDLSSVFDPILTREDVTKSKPDPEIYLNTAKVLHVAPALCVAVEDSPVGAAAAIAAGMQCFIILNGLNNKTEFSDAAISGFISGVNDFAKLNLQGPTL